MARALHYVFKIGNRRKAYDFFIKTLGMKVLRHEEFEEGCKATCNGPYDGKWSKTMVGYGAEDDHFVIELTYNYNIGSYKLGNDFSGIFIESPEVFSRCKDHLGGTINADGFLEVKDPDGHTFYIKEGDSKIDRVFRVALNTLDLEKTFDYWTRLLGMKVVSRNNDSCVLCYGEAQCQVEWRRIEGDLHRYAGFGRIAFSVPSNQLESIQKRMEAEHQTVQTPLVKLDTPGKATVEVVILADPNGHEICFVGDEAFRELSHVDAEADGRLKEEIEKDNSDDWFKDGKAQAE